MTQDNRSKILERIKNLLAMSKDESSTHEAEIALRRARKLMDEHQVTYLDIENISQDDFKEEIYNREAKQVPKWISILAYHIALFNDCNSVKRTQCKLDNTGMERVVVFKGFKEDVAVAMFMLDYLVSTGLKMYKQDKTKYNIVGVKGRNSYLIGFTMKITDRLKELKEERESQYITSTGTDLVLAKRRMVEDHFGARRSKSFSVVVGKTEAFLGSQAAEKVHLGSFLSGQSESKGLGKPLPQLAH